MTETDWLGGNDPRLILPFLFGRASDRKLRLFACACCRRIWNLLTEEDSRKALEIAERYADNAATKDELRVARKRAMRNWQLDPADTGGNAAGVAASLQSAYGAADRAHRHAVNAVAYRAPFDDFLQARGDEFREVCNLLREIIGNPFRPATAAHAWLTPTVTALALSIYDERRFQDLPILADAVVEEGCTNTEVVTHLRTSGGHVRGCWALDLILRKE